MIGEILNAETAAIACRAAFVGRLELSTLHVNRPQEAAARLRDLGVEPYIVEAVLRGALGQELVSEDGRRALRRGGLRLCTPSNLSRQFDQS